MTRQHWSFLKHSDSSFGYFYPKHYIMAGYDSIEDARRAEKACCEAGFDAEDVRAVEGAFVVSQLETQHGENWIERMKEHIADFFATEAGGVDEDIELARHGGAFLFVHAPDDDSADRAKQVLDAHPPRYARRYLEIAIEQIKEQHRN